MTRPKRTLMLRRIREMGGWDNIFLRVASGDSLTSIASELGVHRAYLRREIRKDPERLTKLQAAKIEAAESYIDKAVDVVDESDESKESVLKARAQADTYLRVAGMHDREHYGPVGAQIRVEVNNAALHLDALRHPLPARLPEPVEEAPESVEPPAAAAALPPATSAPSEDHA